MWSRVPGPIRQLLEKVEGSGQRVALIGDCVRELAGGSTPLCFEAVVDCSAETLLAIFPQAVMIRPTRDAVLIPSAAGPLDVSRMRGELTDELARRDFRFRAVACLPPPEGLLDPSRGLDDLAAGRLRCVGTAAERLQQDPVLAVRAARLAAEHGLDPDAELEAALAETKLPATEGARDPRLRQELERLLLAPEPARGLDLLRRSGLEAQLAPRVREDAARVVAALPADLTLRLAGWLRGTDAGRALVRLRTSRPRVRDVERLLRTHPIEQTTHAREASVRRLLQRAGEENVRRLIVLREAELAGDESPDARAATRRLSALGELLERVKERTALRKLPLALSGAEVMRILGRGPGPHIGRALRALAERVSQDPDCNTPERLEALLRSETDQP